MKKTAVVYWSSTGNTEAMAQAVLEGMKAESGQSRGVVMTEDAKNAALLAKPVVIVPEPARQLLPWHLASGCGLAVVRHGCLPLEHPSPRLLRTRTRAGGPDCQPVPPRHVTDI